MNKEFTFAEKGLRIMVSLFIVFIVSVLISWVVGLVIIQDVFDAISLADEAAQRTGVIAYIGVKDVESAGVGGMLGSAFMVALVLGTLHFFLILPVLLVTSLLPFGCRVRYGIAGLFTVLWYCLCYDKTQSMAMPLTAILMPICCYASFRYLMTRNQITSIASP